MLLEFKSKVKFMFLSRTRDLKNLALRFTA